MLARLTSLHQGFGGPPKLPSEGGSRHCGICPCRLGTPLTPLGEHSTRRSVECSNTHDPDCLVPAPGDRLPFSSCAPFRPAPAHGYAISRWVRERTEGAFTMEDAALYQALHRLEEKGVIEAEWGVSENNRRAKYYCAHNGRPAATAQRSVDSGSSTRPHCSKCSKSQHEVTTMRPWGIKRLFSFPSRTRDEVRADVDDEARVSPRDAHR